jgi:CBS domain-containing protein/anti-sigma regulatory factor (Ser/Thr protein kinase)
MAEDERFTRAQELVYESKVGDVMTREVITVRPENSMSDFRKILKENLISGAPVVNGHHHLVGIISIEDFINWLNSREGNIKIKERMSRDVKTVYVDEPLIQAVSQFKKFGFGRFPVIERETRNLVGMLTKGDIIKGILKQIEIDYHGEEIHRYRASHIFEDIIADHATLTLQYTVNGGNFKNAGKSSSDLKKTLSRLNVHPRIIRRVVIATYEAEMNIVIFAKKGELIVEVTPEHIRIEVRDVGPGIPDIEKAMQSGYSTAPDWVREMGFGAGMGLENIKKCSDELDIKSQVGKGTHLTFTIKMEDV